MAFSIRNKTVKNFIGFVIVILIFNAGILLWTGPLGELLLRFRLSPHPELLKQPPGRLSVLYPRPGTLFPPEIASPTVFWTDSSSSARKWLVLVETEDDEKLASAVSRKPEWRPSERLWTKMKRVGFGRAVRISVYGIRGFTVLSGSRTFVRTSPDSVSGCIFYRAVPLPFDYALQHLDSIRWHLGNISSPNPPPALLKNLPLCGNCHSFSANGRTMAMDVDYANDKGSYVISEIYPETVLTPDKIITWSDYRRKEGAKTFGLLSQISPDGHYVLSTVKDRSIFVAKDNFHYSQLFFPVKGIIAVYDRKAKKFRSLPGADDPAFVQSNPVWSPDGKTVYFAKARVYHSIQAEASKEAVLPTSMAAEFIEGRRGFQYDVYRIPFNGGKGGKPETLPGAFRNGMSNYFPRPSPDGKWIVFTRAKNFMLLQPDSKLYILPARGGTPRLMTCNTDSMNSWHSWSPNGRWLIFASKFRGPYTDILLTHVDSLGIDTPPVLLDWFSLPDRSANIPEFVNTKSSRFSKITDRFTDQPHYYFTMGRNLMGERRYQEAISFFDKVIQSDPSFAEAYVYKGHAYNLLGEYRRAVEAYGRAVALDPKNSDTFVNQGSALYHMQDYKNAIASYDRAIGFDPQNAYAYFSRGSARAKLDDFRAAIRDFDRAVALGRSSEDVYYERGLCRVLSNNLVGGLADLETAVRLKPDHAEAHQKTGSILYQLGRFQEASDAYTQALKYKSDDRISYTYRAACRKALKDWSGALDDYNQAIRIDPNSAVDWYQRGLVKIQLGDRDSGCTDLDRAQGMGYAGAEQELNKYCRGN
jgi:tetratricopeptide (TPR) repeat protein